MKSVDFEKMCEEMRNADDGDARRVTIQGLENIKKAKKETRNNRRQSMAFRRNEHRRISKLSAKQIAEREKKRRESIQGRLREALELKEIKLAEESAATEIERSYREMERETKKELLYLQREKNVAETYDVILARAEHHLHEMSIEESRTKDDVPITKIGLQAEMVRQRFHTPIKSRKRF